MSRSLREILDEGNPNKVPAANQVARMGTLLTGVPKTVRAVVATNVLTLPEEARAARVLSAFAVAGTSTGYKIPDVQDAAAAAGEVAINAEGNILFNGTDAVTEAEVSYVEHEGDLFEEVVTVDTATDLANMPGAKRGVLLLEAEALAGSATGVLTINARGTAAPGAGTANLNDDGVVDFAAADNVTQARIKYIATPGVGTAKASAGVALDTQDKDF